MEVFISETSGLPEGCLLSVRAGSTRRQAPVPLSGPLRFPTLPFNAKQFKVDVLKSLGTAKLDIEAKKQEERYSVALDMYHGGQGRVGFLIREEPSLCGKKACELKQFDRSERFRLDAMNTKSPASSSVPASPTEQKGAKIACETMDYAKEHNIPSIIQEMLQHILRERPTAPYSIMSAYLRRIAEGRGEVLDPQDDHRANIAAVAHAPQVTNKAPIPPPPPPKEAAESTPMLLPMEAKSLPPHEEEPRKELLRAAPEEKLLKGGGPTVQGNPDNGPEDLERLRLEADHMALRAERAALLQELHAIAGT